MKRSLSLVLAVLMVLMAYIGALGMNAKYFSAFHQLEKIGKGSLTIAAALAVVLAWLVGRLEKPLRALDVSIGVSSAIALIILRGSGKAMGQFLLILALLLVIIWLVGGMIRRQMTERKQTK